jgi:hypothetical protein
MKAWHVTLGLVAGLLIGGAVAYSPAQDGGWSPHVLWRVQARVAPAPTVPPAPPGPWSSSPRWVWADDVRGIAPATGPNDGHTTLTIGVDQLHYSIVVWGPPSLYVEALARDTIAQVEEVE